MNGSAASGLSLRFAKPPSSSMSSGESAPSTARRERAGSRAASMSVAPLTAPRPVTANWLAYVPEKPACEFQYESWPGTHVDVVGRDAEDVGDDLRRGRLVALALRRRAERDDDLAEDVELDRRHLVVARELQLRVDELRLAEVVRAGVERRADADPEQLPARLGVAPPLLDPVVADQLERLVEAARVVAGVVDAAVRRLVRHLVGADVVPLARPRPGRGPSSCATMSITRSVNQRCCMRE